MSSSRGSTTRDRPQKHQNRTSFRNNLHDTSKRTKLINSLQVSGVCERCKQVIEWKIKYKKYKPLTAPAKCVCCGNKTVKHAYHVLCEECRSTKKVCAKCTKALLEEEKPAETSINAEIQDMIKTLPERKRRTVLRNWNKQDGTQKTQGTIKEILSGMDKINFNDDDSLNDDFLGDLSD